ncbi:MAG TPA: hypothetical protein VGI32_14980 [Steroidobacteraceae bacterium]
MSAKLGYGAQQWLYVQRTLYQSFATVGGTIEVTAVVAALILAYCVRHDRASLRLAATGAACLAIALGTWVLATNPVNIEVRGWTAQAIPTDWPRWRSQWEYSHLARFVLHFIGFCTIGSAFLSVPRQMTGATRSRGS